MSDPYFANVTLLLHMDGADESTSFPDNSNDARTVTAAGNAQVDTTIKKFGTGSCLLDGTGDWLSTPNGSDLIDFTQPLTVECWIYPTLISGATQAVFGTRTDSGTNNGISLRLQGTNQIRAFGFASGGGVVFDFTSANNAITLDEWQHVALTRDSDGLWTIWVGGASVGGDTESGTASQGEASFTIGESSSNPFSGNIDEFRLTNTVDRYAEAFTPPSGPFPDSGGPLITVQPTDDDVIDGGTAEFSVTATGTGTLTYQWKDGDTGDPIIGETSSIYSFIAGVADDGNTYYCTVTDDEGSTDTDTVTLNVNSVMSILTQPESQIAEVGEEVTFSVTVQDNDGPVVYQWYVVTNSGPEAILGETSSSLIFEVSLEDYNTSYYVEADDGVTELTSNAVDLFISLPKEYGIDVNRQLGPIFRRGTVVLDSPISKSEGIGLLVRRKTPITNDFLAEEFLPFQPEQFEHQIDRYTMILQEIEGDACACPPTYEIPSGIPPDAFDDIDEEFPPECYPYTCNAFETDALLLGDAYWPLDDPTYSDIRPEIYRKIDTVNDLGYELKFEPESLAGNNWGGTVITKDVAGFLNPCDGDLKVVKRDNNGSESPPFGFYISPNPFITAGHPLVNFSCVTIGPQEGNFYYSSGGAELQFREDGILLNPIECRMQMNMVRAADGPDWEYTLRLSLGRGPFPPFADHTLPNNFFDDGKAHFVASFASANYIVYSEGGREKIDFVVDYEVQVDDMEFSGTVTTNVRDSAGGTVFSDIVWLLEDDSLGMRFMERTPEMAWLGFSWGTGEGAARAAMYNAYQRNFADYEVPEYCVT